MTEEATDERGTLLRPGAEDALAAWTAQASAHHEQVDRLYEFRFDRTFTPERAASFRPVATDAPEVAGIVIHAQPGDTWIDVGAGGGRFAVPLSRVVRRLIALEPSPEMRAALAASMEAEGRDNVETVDVRWPLAPGAEDHLPIADGVLAANVLYGSPQLRTFIDTMEAHARRVCVVMLSDRVPMTPDPAVFEAFYGEPLKPVPALVEFLAVLGALGRTFEVRAYSMPAPRPMTADDALADSRWRFGVREGSPHEARLRHLLVTRYGDAAGLVRLPPRRTYSAVVSWTPPATS